MSKIRSENGENKQADESSLQLKKSNSSVVETVRAFKYN